MKKLIGYSDFIELCKIEDPKNFLIPGIELRPDGVWIVPPPDDVLLCSQERAILSAHPKKDLTIPALKFPCSYRQLRNFLEYVEVGLADTYLGTDVSEVANNEQNYGRPKGPLYEAVEFAYKKFLDECNTEILRSGKINEFLDRLKELANDENLNLSDYIAERIEIVKKRNGSFIITTKEKIVKEGKLRVIKDKKINYSKKDVSKIMTALREKYPLAI